MCSRHASPFSLQRLNERWWMGAQKAANGSEQARTNPQTSSGRDIHRQFDPIQLLCIQSCTSPIWRQREPISQKVARLCLRRAEADVCVVMAECVQAQCLYIFIHRQRSQCVRTSVCLCQRGFPFASVAQSHTGRGWGGWQRAREYRGSVQAHLH